MTETTPKPDTDIDLKSVLYSGLGLIVLVVVAAFGMQALLGWLTDEQAEANPTRYPLAAEEYQGPIEERLDRGTPPEPQLEGLDLRSKLRSGVAGWPSLGPALHRKEEAELASFGNIDETEGVVRIPIELAMKKLVEDQYWREPLLTETPPPPDFETPSLPSDASAGRRTPGGGR